MPRPLRVRIAVLVGALVALAVVPGWEARLRPVDHDRVLAAARAADPDQVFGVALPGALPGERWHAQYAGGRVAAWLHALGLEAALPGLVTPDHAAHLPPGAERADGYYAVDATLHWPWWWPGGGVLWQIPDED